ncbi:MAG: hypothetical protein ORO03_11375 [Alphaproteobacteria bacterium]|nr:hypothetical protein [Alphaproteobacteria bacterium]
MVWMIAGMVFLAVIFAAGTMMVLGSMGRWQSDLAGSATVQIMPNVDLPSNQQREQINRDSAEMVNLLRQIKGILQVEAISESRNRELLAPFLGSIDLGELPMPRLISVTLDPRQVRPDTLRALVVQKNPTARYESHLDWLSGLVSLAHGLVFLGTLILILVFALALVTVMIVTRSNLNIHLDIIEVMHFMGADEKFIARSFVWHSFSLSFLGALFGGIFAAITIWLIGLIGLGE